MAGGGFDPVGYGGGWPRAGVRMILEGLVSTCKADGSPHLSAMGPRVEAGDIEHFLLRPFPSSRTFENLRRHPQGVLHVTDDVVLLAQAALGEVNPQPGWEPAQQVRGWVLTDACRHYEFVVRSFDERGERMTLACEVVARGRRRDFFGFNRAKHAVLEAAILATRLHLLPLAQVTEEFRKLRGIVDKTGGEAERFAMSLLEERLAREAARKGRI